MSFAIEGNIKNVKGEVRYFFHICGLVQHKLVWDQSKISENVRNYGRIIHGF